MGSGCLFCGIINREIDSQIIYEDKEVVGFKDINPQAPIHYLFVPRKHIETLNDISEKDAEVFGKIFVRIKEVAAKENVEKEGYRIVVNCNKGAGQAVFHVHVHLLGGRRFTWPPG